MTTIETSLHNNIAKAGFDILKPKTIQEKIAWLMLHDSTPVKGLCADKIGVHEYSKRVLGEDICVPLIKTYKSVSEIKLSDLPDQFVMKTNHGTAMNIICKDKSKFDLKKYLPQLEKWQKTNFGVKSGQPHYVYIEPKIMVEKLLIDENQTESLFDYKFWCFNGKPEYMTVNDGHGHGKMTFYDCNFNKISLKRTDFEPLDVDPEKPKNFDKMLEYAKKLSAEFPFVRVDFYEVSGKLYLGELTFTPGNCKFRYAKKEDDLRMGNLIKLPTKTYEEGVSICLTGYKVQNYIEEALDSVYRQTWFKTHSNWEVLLGIDACPDTLKKVREIMHKYKNFRVFMMDSNCRTYVASNTVMQQAKYKWLFRFDGDDIMLPELVDTVMKEKGTADYITYKLINFGDGGIGRRHLVTKTCGQMCMSHKLFDETGGFLPWTCSGDAELEKRVARFYTKKMIDRVLMKRRIHENNLTVNKTTNMASPLRRENLSYMNTVTIPNKNRQRSVVATITNTFTEIKDKNTPWSPREDYTFPKLDVAYQEGKTIVTKLHTFSYARTTVTKQTAGDNYMYTSSDNSVVHTHAYAGVKKKSTEGEESSLGNLKRVVFTCITGGYEPLDEPEFISEGFDYVCFTDARNIKSKTWQIRPIPYELSELSPVKMQRAIKICPHRFLPEYDLSIWVDGSIKLRGDLNEFVKNQCGENYLCIPKHPVRTCIYKEMTTCERMKKDTPENIEPMRRLYLEEGFPKEFGLVQSNIIVRRHNQPECISLMETWLDILVKYSHRDQLSFDYARWKHPETKVLFLDKRTCKGKYFNWDPYHGRKRNSTTVNSLGLPENMPLRKHTVAKTTVVRPSVVKPTRSKIIDSNVIAKRRDISDRLKAFIRK